MQWLWKLRLRSGAALAAIALFSPSICFAQALAGAAGLFYALSGIILAVGILTFIAGFAMWFNNLDTYPSKREETIKTMRLGVVILFALILTLFAVRFVQEYTVLAYLGIILAVIFFIASILMQPGAEKDKKDEKKEH